MNKKGRRKWEMRGLHRGLNDNVQFLLTITIINAESNMAQKC
jgi:hypothetical protein